MERHPFGGTQECAHCGFECAVRDRLPSNFGARYAYYFGPAKNIAGILRWGHLAHNYAKKIPWRTDLGDAHRKFMDMRREYWSDVCLYFGYHTATQKTQKACPERELVFIKYDADELFMKNGARFSTGNLISSGTIAFSAESESESLEQLKWRLILYEKNTPWHRMDLRTEKAAELVIPHYIEPQAIKSVHVYSEEMKAKLETEWNNIRIYDGVYRVLLKEISEQGVNVTQRPQTQFVANAPEIHVSKDYYF